MMSYYYHPDSVRSINKRMRSITNLILIITAGLLGFIVGCYLTISAQFQILQQEVEEVLQTSSEVLQETRELQQELMYPAEKTDVLEDETIIEEALVFDDPVYDQPATIPDLGWDWDYVLGVVAQECWGEPYDGQMAVAQCILDTAQLRNMTPEEVVKLPGRYASPLDYDKAKSAVEDACIAVFILGERITPEPIEYFYSTAGGKYSHWHETDLTHVMTIGNHKFFKTKEAL